MIYHSSSLNGAWEMAYSEAVYTGTTNPWTKGFLIENAVPGYWEDMTDDFSLAPFYGRLKINPEYGMQRYPISGEVPDMALPNIMGNFYYRRTVCCDSALNSAILHFDGVQNAVSVWVNGVYLGRHEGYSTPFDMAIPEGVLHSGENEVVLSVSNIDLIGYDGFPVSGLTNRAANQYTGGITGDVELRTYCCPLRDVAVSTSKDCSQAIVYVNMSEKASFTWRILDEDKEVLSGNACGDFCFETKRLKMWSPEEPKCYILELACQGRTLSSQFGIRRLTVDGVQLKLNGNPVFLRGICEHCYFPETVHPTHDIAFYRNVIRSIKRLGFNFIRFHTFVPAEEYMQAADELRILLEVESPNNTTLDEWKQIVHFCRRHPSVVIYSGGNEMHLTDARLEHLRKCAQIVHKESDSLFSPMSALGGMEYNFTKEPELLKEIKNEPFRHNSRRFEMANKFCDVYNNYSSIVSYYSLLADPEKIDQCSVVYNKPRLGHEICIQGTYTDLSLKSRYADSRIGKTDMFDSIERHLKVKGLLHKAPLYFKNSSEWQRRLRKYTFEAVRRSQTMAGFDFLGPIDTHWHTFGYDVGMMNEFYELKPGETVRNVLMYNSETVLLTDLSTDVNYTSGDALRIGIFLSHYGKATLHDARLNLRLTLEGKLIYSRCVQTDEVKSGEVAKLYDLEITLPQVEKPGTMKLYATLECGDIYSENEWELYLFPQEKLLKTGDILISEGMTVEELTDTLRQGKDVLLLGAEPFASLPTSFQIALAGRTAGNLATVIKDHPLMVEMPHEGFCGWQFRRLLEDGKAVCFESDDVPFDPIIEVVSTHKFIHRQAALFEFRVLGGRLLVCGLHFSENDPAANWLKNRLITYMQSDAFAPEHSLTMEQLMSLSGGKRVECVGNTNFASNPNDKAVIKKKESAPAANNAHRNR